MNLQSKYIIFNLSVFSSLYLQNSFEYIVLILVPSPVMSAQRSWWVDFWSHSWDVLKFEPRSSAS